MEFFGSLIWSCVGNEGCGRAWLKQENSLESAAIAMLLAEKFFNNTARSASGALMYVGFNWLGSFVSSGCPVYGFKVNSALGHYALN